MLCAECGTHYGSRVRVFSHSRGWHTLTLCSGCIEGRIAEGDKETSFQPYSDWLEEREDERADRALAER